ncbi:MAG: LysR family transcriptional regulator [Kangiellaceae bacterium]|nr:LysR family transcriptional regulator [Kangiellaceae bacterium]
MKLQQLRYLLATVENNFNITTAAERIYTSQPGISKQLKLLEEELDLKIFERSGKQLIGLTASGEQVVLHARRALQEVENIKRLSEDKNQVEHGSFRLATTQTQAKYVLPTVLTRFHQRYPNLAIDIQHSSVDHIIQMLLEQKIEFAIASDNQSLHPDIIKIPCYEWDRVILFPQDHELGNLKQLSLEDIASFPIVTYKEPATGNSGLVNAMSKKDLLANIVFTARDADVIKTYVRKNIGIGIVAEMAFDSKVDSDLISYSTRGMLPRCTTWLAFNKNLLMRNYMYAFIELFAPHLSREEVNSYLTNENKSDKTKDSPENESNLPMHTMWHI